MKTTLDIPDPLFLKAKARVALRGFSLRHFVAEALEEKVAAPASGRQRGRAFIIDICSTRGGITKLARSANLLVGFV